ncbi:ABC-2 type transport system ATP-binding protein [Cyclonatronum proteinivorum]|uniref:ABC-2 type transport system ATP-binding protein n=1 Tax=Cyclonatronum proteinivorum TaxID=1457365 RepID=A0A345UMU3_9BACT|nr:ABC transporter ATP-binding protein [Cyclonatronum proteinivorum]AXJ01795.1 ABC-2 type transport system ATP-binding protein [Cyclonatronum proteinivorum]
MISAENLFFTYPKTSPLFESFSFRIKAGGIYGLLGLNGAGKTTLMRLMAGLLFPQSGNCNFMGKPSSERHPVQLAECYLVPEQFSLPDLSITGYLRLVAPFYPKFDEAFFEEAISLWGLDRNQQLSQLSFGQHKKMLLAFAFALNTKLLLLDEPTNGLDIPGKSQFRKLLAGLDTSERCILISTHQVRDVGQQLDHLLVLKNGSMVVSDSLANLSSNWHCTVLQESERDRAVYAEKQLGGYRAVVPAASDTAPETEFDLELFFNAAIHEPAAFSTTLYAKSTV